MYLKRTKINLIEIKLVMYYLKSYSFINIRNNGLGAI
jgi:hypothetical protein